MKRQTFEDPEQRATALAALWAQRIGLPPGNAWEPVIARAVLAEFHRLGGDANAWGFVEARYRMKLGLEAPK